MFEGTGKYFLMILLILLIVYITVKVCLYFLFKRAKTPPYKALIPIYTTAVLVDLLNMKRRVFYLCLIPFVNLFYYYKIYQELLEGFGQEKKEAIWYVLIPMYKFPELVFKKPRFILNEYDLTNAFMESQKALFETPKEELPNKIELVNLTEKVDEFHEQKTHPSPDNETGNEVVIEPIKYDQMPGSVSSAWDNNIESSINSFQNNNVRVDTPDNSYQQNAQMTSTNNMVPPTNNYQGDSVFTNKSLEPDKRQEKEYIAKKEEKKETNPINPAETGRPQLCPNCGARLSPGATTCFLCGTKLK